MMRRSLCTAALLALLISSVHADVRTTKAYVDPIGGTAHGAVWSPEGMRIQVDASFIERAIETYTARALLAVSPQVRQRHLDLAKYLADSRPALPAAERQVVLYERNLLLHKLVRDMRAPDSGNLASRAGLLERWLREGMANASGQRYDPPAHLAATYLQLGLAAAAAPAAPPAAVIQARETYVKQCVKKGVPAPPSWGDPAWKSKGVLDKPFIDTGKKAELYAYESKRPAGICLALPRYTVGSTGSMTFGIVCMGKATGSPAVVSACFWDNQLNNAQVEITLAPAKPLPITIGWEAGTKMGMVGGVCTSCHAGENAFVTHPEEAAFIALGDAIKPDDYYKPHIRGDWPQNDGPNTLLGGAVPAGESKCTSCHNAGSKRRLPEITEDLVEPVDNYCNAVLETAIKRRTMPDVGVGADPAYMTHNKILLDACDAAKARAKANAAR